MHTLSNTGIKWILRLPSVSTGSEQPPPSNEINLRQTTLNNLKACHFKNLQCTVGVDWAGPKIRGLELNIYNVKQTVQLQCSKDLCNLVW